MAQFVISAVTSLNLYRFCRDQGGRINRGIMGVTALAAFEFLRKALIIWQMPETSLSDTNLSTAWSWQTHSSQGKLLKDNLKLLVLKKAIGICKFFKLKETMIYHFLYLRCFDSLWELSYLKNIQSLNLKNKKGCVYISCIQRLPQTVI